MLRARDRVGVEVRPEFWLSDDECAVSVGESNFVFSAFLVSQKAIEKLVGKPEEAEALLADELKLMQKSGGVHSLVVGGVHFIGIIALSTVVGFLLDGAQMPAVLPAQILFLTTVVLLIGVAASYLRRGPSKTIEKEYGISRVDAETAVFGVVPFGLLFGPGRSPLRGPKGREASVTAPFPSALSATDYGLFLGTEPLEPDDQSRELEDLLRATPEYASVRVIKRKFRTDASATELVVRDSDSGRLFLIPHTATESLKSGPDLLAYAAYQIDVSRAIMMQNRGYLRIMAVSLLAAVLLSAGAAMVLKLDFFIALLVAFAVIVAALLLSLIPLSSRLGRAEARAELDVQARYPRLMYALETVVKYERQQMGYSVHESVLLNLRTSGRESLQASADY